MKKLFSFLLLILLSQRTQAQVKLSASPGAADGSAILELQSTGKGLLLPRMTLAERKAISAPATGLIIYNTTYQCMEVYDGSVWGCLDPGSSMALPQPPATGSTFTEPHGLNFEAFSGNTHCTGNLISAGYDAASCNGSFTVGSTTYPKVLIYGQCWMGKNLNEAPSNFPYINGWPLTLSDIGRWGYYNTAVPSGTSGFQATEPAAGEGRLYQWSAAMNGSTAERAQGACPAGWHVASDCEWMYLEHGLGMVLGEQPGTACRGSYHNISKQLLATAAGGWDFWGFNLLLSGYRTAGSYFFQDRGSGALIWTSTPQTGVVNESFYRLFKNSDGCSQRLYASKAHGMSVRCLAD